MHPLVSNSTPHPPGEHRTLAAPLHSAYTVSQKAPRAPAPKYNSSSNKAMASLDAGTKQAKQTHTTNLTHHALHNHRSRRIRRKKQ